MDWCVVARLSRRGVTSSPYRRASFRISQGASWGKTYPRGGSKGGASTQEGREDSRKLKGYFASYTSVVEKACVYFQLPSNSLWFFIWSWYSFLLGQNSSTQVWAQLSYNRCCYWNSYCARNCG